MADPDRIDELRRRLDRDPSSVTFAALAEEYRRAGRYREAIETCRAGLAQHPMYLSARVTLGRSLIEVGEFEQARAELSEVLKVAPENLAAIRALADTYHRGRQDLGRTDDGAPPKRSDTPRPHPAQAALERFLGGIQAIRRERGAAGV